jgi:Spy/CpxP family protein refolding chaperone
MSRLPTSFAVIAAAIVLGLMAGLGGAWLGLSREQAPPDFPHVVSQLLGQGGADLSHDQQATIDELRKIYEADRLASGLRLQTALVALAEAVVQKSDNPDQVAAAAALVDRIVAERRTASIAYITSARAVLTPDQREAFDKAFLQVVANDPSYSQ